MPGGLAELRAKLPWGDPGRIVNSLIFPSHPDTIVSAIRRNVPPFQTRSSWEIPTASQEFLEAVRCARVKHAGHFAPDDALTVSLDQPHWCWPWRWTTLKKEYVFTFAVLRRTRSGGMWALDWRSAVFGRFVRSSSGAPLTYKGWMAPI